MAARKRKHGLGESSDFAMPIYLVLEREDEQSDYSVLKIDAAAAVAGSGNEASRARIVSGLPGAERGMSFVAAYSRFGSWIVGVGGSSVRTIVFDLTTLEMSWGPRLMHPKHQPVLISHGDQVYVISRRPRFARGVDFDPWFECFCFNNGGVNKITQEYLPPPPFLPCFMDPYEYRNLPEFCISSYAAVGSHILFSVQPELGTYAFHVLNKTWEKIWDKNLPFVEQAMPLGGNLFAACRRSNDCATAVVSLFYMSINVSLTTPMVDVSTPSLSIQEFPLGASEGNITWPILCPLGKGSFCSIKSTHLIRHKTNFLKEIQVILTAIQLENIDAVLSACKHQGARSKDLRVALQVKEQSHTYRYNCKGRYQLLDSHMPVVAALSWDTGNIKLFEGEIK